MSSIQCACGHSIRDQADALPYKARLLADQDEDRFWLGIATDLAELLAATRGGKRSEWISRHFLPGYPRDVDDVGLIADFLGRWPRATMRTAYQCEQCGRLLLEELADADRFRFFVPEGAAEPDVLSSRGEPSEPGGAPARRRR